MAKRRNYDDEGIKNDYLSGMNVKDIMNKHGFKDHHIVYKILDKFNIERKCKSWDKDKLNLLREKYPNGEWSFLLEKLYPFTHQEISAKASKLGILKIMLNEWTKEELHILNENYGKINTKDILSMIPNHSYKSITTKAKRLGLKTREYWSDDEINNLKDVYSTKNKRELLKLFPNRNSDTITVMANKLGLIKERDFLREDRVKNNKKLMLDSLLEFSKKLGRTPTTFEISQNENMAASTSYHRYFGSYSEACNLIGLTPNCGTFGDFTSVQYSKNNDVCYSNSELIITNFLIDNDVNYEKENLYSELTDDVRCGFRRMDWLIDGEIIVEYFGLPNNEQYAMKMEEKYSICSDNNLSIISIMVKDISTKGMNGLIEKIYPYFNKQNIS